MQEEEDLPIEKKIKKSKKGASKKKVKDIDTESINNNEKVKKRKAKRNNDSFAFYIYNVLKQMYPEIGVSRKAMSIMNSFVNDTYERITNEASKLVKW